MPKAFTSYFGMRKAGSPIRIAVGGEEPCRGYGRLRICRGYPVVLAHLSPRNQSTIVDTPAVRVAVLRGKRYFLREHNGDTEASTGGGGGEEIMATGQRGPERAEPRARRL